MHVDVFARLSVVGHLLYGACQQRIVRRHCSGVAQSAQILAGIEAPAVGVALGEDDVAPASVVDAVCLRAVVHEEEAPLVGQTAEPFHAAAASVEMHGQQRHRALRTALCCAFGRHQRRLLRGFYGHGLQTRTHDGQQGGNEGVGRHDDFVAVPPSSYFFCGHERQRQRIEPVAAVHAVVPLAALGPFAGEASVPFAQQIPSVFGHTRHPLAQLGLMTAVQTHEREIFYPLRGLLRQSRREVHLIDVVAYGASAEAFFLEDEPLVEPAPVILGADAEVQIIHPLVALRDEVLEEQVERAARAPLLAGGDVLHVGHTRRFEDDASGHHSLSAPHVVEPDVGGESRHEQLHLLHAVHGSEVVTCAQHLLQYMPEFPEALRLAFAHALHVAVGLQCLLHAALTQGAHPQGGLDVHCGGGQTPFLAGVQTREGVEVLLCGLGAIYIRYGFVDERPCAECVAPVACGLGKCFDGLLRGGGGAHDESAVGQPLMAPHRARRLFPVGGQQRHEVFLVPQRQRAVREAVLMVFHEVALQQKGAVLRRLHEAVPQRPVFAPIGSCLDHARVRLRNSS